MAAEPDRHDDPLEDTELARRLRRMKWPSAPPEVKQRVFERILEHGDEIRRDPSTPPASDGKTQP